MIKKLLIEYISNYPGIIDEQKQLILHSTLTYSESIYGELYVNFKYKQSNTISQIDYLLDKDEYEMIKKKLRIIKLNNLYENI